MAQLNRLDINLEEESPLTYAEQLRKTSLVSIVDDALKDGNAGLAFQPVVSNAVFGKAIFYEGLIRMPDPMGRITPVGQFIDKVEERGTGRLIDCLPLDMGLRPLVRAPDFKLSVNLSARSIGYGKWLETFARGLRTDSTLGERLILEITERSAMLVPELVTKFMCDLQKKGISFALDDFGSVSTSFRHLNDFCLIFLRLIEDSFMELKENHITNC